MHSKPNRTPIQPRNAPMRPGLSVSPGTRHMQDDTKYAITMDNVNKWFGHLHVLKDIDIRIKDKEKVVICGPSGSGKSTLIRCINGLEEHQQGRIVVDGVELCDDRKSVV